MRKVFVLLLLSTCALGQQFSGDTPPGAFRLSSGWSIQSSLKVAEKGDTVSTASFQPSDWLPAESPATVVAAQLMKGLLPDPFYGMNLRQYPGMTYPIGANFSNLPADPESPYAVSWWYRTEFALPRDYAGKRVWLNFRGVNYRANVWLNGKQIADSKQVAGAWRTYEFNVTDAVKNGTNALALQIWPPN